MAGQVKRKYHAEIMLYKKSFTAPLKKIAEILPADYDKHTILNFFKEFYPIEWDKLAQRTRLYEKKDIHLQSVGKKKRYYPEPSELFFFGLAKVKNMISSSVRNKHRSDFDSDRRDSALKSLSILRENKILIAVEKNDKSKIFMQSIEPLYVDVFISSFHKKGSSTQDKIEILNELKKYNCEKTMDFFHKLNDSERNNQVRRMAFEHLQKTVAFVRLRKNFKGKTKVYVKERSDFCVTPKDLVARIESNSIQNKKKYDVFVSHSSKDEALVMDLKKQLNEYGLSIYCDWISDNDFLKRELAGEFTEIVLKTRIKQSNTIIFVQTKNSINSSGEILSKWIKMEIDFTKEIMKPIYYFNLNDENSVFDEVSNFLRSEVFSLSSTDKLRSALS